MKAAFVRTDGGVELRDVPEPQLVDGAIVVEMKASGVCGTDLEKLSRKNIASSILGHEVSGIVSKSSNDLFPVGLRVVPHHHVACGHCELCLAGAETSCEQFRKSNFVPCGFADHFLVPKYNVENGGVHPFNKDLSFEEASMAEPLACCVRGISHLVGNRISDPRRSVKRVLVIGSGPIGLMHMELLKSYFPETKIVASDIIPRRLEFAERFENAVPIDSNNLSGEEFVRKALAFVDQAGYDLVIVATGSTSAFGEGVRCARRSGTILLFGAPLRGSVHQLDLAQFFLNELTITCSYATNEAELDSALRLIESGKVDVKKFITGKFPLSEIRKAMDAARSAGQVKVIITS